MHRFVWEHLEELLSGETEPPSQVSAHLGACRQCREELEGFKEQALLLRALRAPGLLQPAPGFYARVWQRIEERQGSSPWRVLLDTRFAWRLALGSLAALAAMAVVLAVNETRLPVPLEPSVESVIAVEDHPPDLGVDPARDRETVLVTLATYRE